jgi:hypothetical protein
MEWSLSEANPDKRERHIENLLLDGSTHLWVGDEFVPLIRAVLERLPLHALEQLEGKVFRFLVPKNQFGRVTRLSRDCRRGELIVFLSPELLLRPQVEGQLVIAHELAHVVLGHEEGVSVNAEETCAEDERDADDLIRSWGFDTSGPLFDRT